MITLINEEKTLSRLLVMNSMFSTFIQNVRRDGRGGDVSRKYAYGLTKLSYWLGIGTNGTWDSLTGQKDDDLWMLDGRGICLQVSDMDKNIAIEIGRYLEGLREGERAGG